MKKINISLKRAISQIENEFKDCRNEYIEHEKYYDDLPKIYKESHLRSLASFQLALICMRYVLKNKCLKELV